MAQNMIDLCGFIWKPQYQSVGSCLSRCNHFQVVYGKPLTVVRFDTAALKMEAN